MARHLTPRLWEVAELAARGKSTKAIGVHLGLSPHTVHHYLGLIFDAVPRLREDRTRALLPVWWHEWHAAHGWLVERYAGEGEHTPARVRHAVGLVVGL